MITHAGLFRQDDVCAGPVVSPAQRRVPQAAARYYPPAVSFSDLASADAMRLLLASRSAHMHDIGARMQMKRGTPGSESRLPAGGPMAAAHAVELWASLRPGTRSSGHRRSGHLHHKHEHQLWGPMCSAISTIIPRGTLLPTSPSFLHDRNLRQRVILLALPVSQQRTARTTACTRRPRKRH